MRLQKLIVMKFMVEQLVSTLDCVQLFALFCRPGILNQRQFTLRVGLIQRLLHLNIETVYDRLLLLLYFRYIHFFVLG